MPLTRVAFATAEVHGIQIRGLSRGEALRIPQFEDPAEAEVFVLVAATATAEDEVREWYRTTPTAVAGEVIDRILELSGLVDGAQFPE